MVLAIKVVIPSARIKEVRGVTARGFTASPNYKIQFCVNFTVIKMGSH